MGLIVAGVLLGPFFFALSRNDTWTEVIGTPFLLASFWGAIQFILFVVLLLWVVIKGIVDYSRGKRVSIFKDWGQQPGLSILLGFVTSQIIIKIITRLM